MGKSLKKNLRGYEGGFFVSVESSHQTNFYFKIFAYLLLLGLDSMRSLPDFKLYRLVHQFPFLNHGLPSYYLASL